MLQFELDGRCISLESSEPEASRFRILVDGVPVPMEVTKTKTFTLFNGETRTREVEPSQPIEWISIEGEATTPTIYRAPRTAGVMFIKPTVSIYNTSVWRSESVLLEFVDDFSRVAVIWDDSIDDTT